MLIHASNFPQFQFCGHLDVWSWFSSSLLNRNDIDLHGWLCKPSMNGLDLHSHLTRIWTRGLEWLRKMQIEVLGRLGNRLGAWNWRFATFCDHKMRNFMVHFPQKSEVWTSLDPFESHKSSVHRVLNVLEAISSQFDLRDGLANDKCILAAILGWNHPFLESKWPNFYIFDRHFKQDHPAALCA